MLPAIVFTLHDPKGILFSHLEAITPLLKSVFAQTFVSVTPLTYAIQTERISQLKTDEFFQINYNPPNTLVGDHFLSAFRNAADIGHPNQVLHLCTIDRIAFIFQSRYKDQFIEDIKAIRNEHTPVLFQRSEAAWETHPQNYCEIEHIATRMGELLLKKPLDFGWCHLAIGAQQLKQILPYIERHDLAFLAEIVLMLKDKIKTKNVNWLSWEDPFIYSRDQIQLKRERESSVRETRRRLACLISVLQVLFESSEKLA